MNTEEISFQLRARRDRLKKLEAVQNKHDAAELVRAERTYVEALLEYHDKHGGFVGIVTDCGD